MKARLLIFALLTAIAAAPAGADEDGVYESLRDIPIGRIFLTAQERARLERIRGQAPVQPRYLPPADDAPEPEPEIDPAGYIVSDSGTTRVWSNGDFVATRSASGVRFPGEVRISSQTVPQVDADAAGGGDDGESPDGAGDEGE